jgi:hypothetical protein
MRANRYYQVTGPFRLYVKVGITDSNTYAGASQMLGNVWKQIDAEPGAELHLLVGGAFYVTIDEAWNCAVELSDKHPFEKVYLPQEQPWPFDALEEIPPGEEVIGFHWTDQFKKKYSQQELDQAHASLYGRGIDYVIPPEETQ